MAGYVAFASSALAEPIAQSRKASPYAIGLNIGRLPCPHLCKVRAFDPLGYTSGDRRYASAQRSEQNHGPVGAAQRYAHKARHLAPDLSGGIEGRRRSWNKAARGQQSIAALPSRCPAQQFQMLRRCWRPAGRQQLQRHQRGNACCDVDCRTKRSFDLRVPGHG
jgi:hypothetical protein